MQILNGIRKEVAQKHLAHKNTSIDEIAYLLGFSEVSAFHRAFKSWTSFTPGEFRKRIIK